MRTDQAYTGTEERVLAVSLELAAAKWKVALHDGHREQPAVHTVAHLQASARLQAALDLIEQHKEKWSLPAGVRVVVSYEAGQDGFWICRALQGRGIECYVIDPASIPVERHKRRAKTDRLDAIKLVINLRAWLRGERDRMHVVHVPSPQDEASRHLMRDRGQLQKEVLQHCDRMRKLLTTLGCWDEVDHKHFAGRLARDEVKCHDGAPLPPEMRERLLRECERLALAQYQLAALEKTRQASLPAPARQRRDDLARLKGSAKWARRASRSNFSGGNSATGARWVPVRGWWPNPTTAARARSTRASANKATDACARYWSRWHGAGCATSPTAHSRAGSTSAPRARNQTGGPGASRSLQSHGDSPLRCGAI